MDGLRKKEGGFKRRKKKDPVCCCDVAGGNAGQRNMWESHNEKKVSNTSK